MSSIKSQTFVLLRLNDSMLVELQPAAKCTNTMFFCMLYKKCGMKCSMDYYNILKSDLW